jgi:phosphatidylglycerophosphate synthase
MLEKLSGVRKKLFAPFLVNINPNYLSIISLLLAFAAAYFLFISSWLLAAVFITLSAFFDALDGEIARKNKIATKFGDFLDHVLDRISDSALLIGLALNPAIPDNLALLTLIFVLLVSYIGTEAQALTGKRLYTALVGRADRLAILAVAALVQIFYSNAMLHALYLILLLSALTFVQRFYLTAKQLRA